MKTGIILTTVYTALRMY